MALPRHSVATLSLAAFVVCGTAVVAARASGDPEAGQKILRIQCAACHAVTAGRTMVGPTLAGIVGRQSGSVEGYRYSDANRRADLVWTPGVLDSYLANPRAVVPGTTMSYAGLRDERQRSDLITYLETLH